MELNQITTENSFYPYSDSRVAHTNAYLMPIVKKELEQLNLSQEKRHVFELGCGNGSTASLLNLLGYKVIGVDPSESGIEFARRKNSDLRFHIGSSDENLKLRFGTFPVVISLEVVEHVFYPRKFATNVFNLLEPGGIALISTPYHGYIKNLVLALTGKLDAHFTALWDYGHIKFWSIRTLSQLLIEAGFREIRFHRVGRIPIFAKSMIAVARKPIA